MSKYKQQFEDMLLRHKAIFDEFKELHDKYAADPKKYQKQFNEEGEDVLVLIQRWDSILCAKSEGGKYGKFSSNLSEKFWGEVRTHFPKIDYVGMGS
jgi:hypothetical protein